MTDDTLPRMVRDRVARGGPRPALRVKRQGRYRDISWAQFGQAIRSFALGLLALDLQPGQTVALVGENRPEWAFTDLAILACRGVTVPIYPTATSAQMAYILKQARCRIVVLSDALQFSKLLGIPESLPHLEIAILMEEPEGWHGGRPPEGAHTWNQILVRGQEGRVELLQRLQACLEEARPEELATIIYTSGTTGEPRGVMLSHANILSNCEAMAQVISVGEEDVHLSFLPLSHIFERMAGYYFILSRGATIAYAERLDTLAQDLLAVRPTVLLGVPRVWELFHHRTMKAVERAPGWRRALFAAALRVGHQAWVAGQQGRRPLRVRLLHPLADRLVLRRIRAALGGRIRLACSGGAALPPHLAEFFWSVGVPLLEGYGLTETAPVVACQTPAHVRPGTVGCPVPGVEVKIAQDGEILVRGPNVMLGYWEDPEATAEALADGWLHTGDVGAVDEAGCLAIVDRKKDIIVTSAGKNVAPQLVENRLRADEFIQEAVVVGDDRKYLAALIVPELARLEEHARARGLMWESPEELVARPEIHALYAERIAARLAELAPHEQVRRFALLPAPFSLEAGELTPTLKVRRRIIHTRYAEQIRALYPD
ncbi:MAG: long-chain fatty acid--CoA ligase [Deltaproteobacteria bacterium]|nr:long-chain fatty acid--CoA ligase [Deltaproteobacteria bacterium]